MNRRDEANERKNGDRNLQIKVEMTASGTGNNVLATMYWLEEMRWLN